MSDWEYICGSTAERDCERLYRSVALGIERLVCSRGSFGNWNTQEVYVRKIGEVEKDWILLTQEKENKMETERGTTGGSEACTKPSTQTTSYLFHKPSDDGMEKINRLRAAFTALDGLLKEVAPDSRQKSVAITQLETAAMWAVKAVVINDPKSEAIPLTPVADLTNFQA